MTVGSWQPLPRKAGAPRKTQLCYSSAGSLVAFKFLPSGQLPAAVEGVGESTPGLMSKVRMLNALVSTFNGGEDGPAVD